ncbi:uncharacterized protein LOC121737617 [Aricia agestis]|uniref:uncharacterized protein LOC121737617 n=1 Tax=Aricia agestis TaxID=91739 RepID=UPI001C2070A5|nr:uncharacterized protein LOC121737617 [Aricia agestis]
MILLVLHLLLLTTCQGYRDRKPQPHYPKNSLFWATDFFVHGCENFLKKCPAFYRQQPICAMSYNGEYKNFENYCKMLYLNCNTWNNWRIYKRERC